jgi:transposase
MRPGRPANAEQKLRAYELVAVEGASKSAAAEQLGVTRPTIYRWLAESWLRDAYLARAAMADPVDPDPPREETRGATRILEDEARAVVLDGYAAGLSLDDCADLAGLERKTLPAWLQKAERGLQPYVQFRLELRRAAAERKLTRLRRIEGGEAGWQGAAWTLERLHQEQFGRRLQADIAVASAAEALSDEELLAIIGEGDAED